ncbi:MAG: glycosyl transferase family protein [Sedimenticola sp.]
MHPFAQYIQILGKGRNGMRSLTEQQAYEAMQMISCYDVEPEQIGAFLMLMRVKEASAEELAGFTRALRESLPVPQDHLVPAIDWAAYAGKKRQLPWFLLAALVVVGRGYPVVMHGMNWSDERLYVPDALDVLDMTPATSLKDAQHQLKEHGFSYLPISKMSALTTQLMRTRELTGLRSPLQTVARMLNPFSAPLSLMGVFHPNFAEIHQRAAELLEQPNALMCKGEGGELERVPDRSVELYGLSGGRPWHDVWQQMTRPGTETKPEKLNLNHFRAVWEGDAEDGYGEDAVAGTLALVIKALDLESDSESAHRLARVWWQERHHASAEREAI